MHADASSETALLVQASMSWASSRWRRAHQRRTGRRPRSLMAATSFGVSALSLSEPHLPIVEALEHTVDDASTGLSRVPSWYPA